MRAFQTSTAQNAVRTSGVDVSQPNIASSHFAAEVTAAEIHCAVVVAKLREGEVRLAASDQSKLPCRTFQQA